MYATLTKIYNVRNYPYFFLSIIMLLSNMINIPIDNIQYLTECIWLKYQKVIKIIYLVMNEK